jgi:predicted glycosyl hydrolase (DUF1957 family)
MNYRERMLLRALTIKYNARNVTQGYARVYNARKGYPNLNVYRELEKAGKLTIHTVDNATTENMLYGMSDITFTLKGN